jgi:thioredoxin
MMLFDKPSLCFGFPFVFPNLLSKRDFEHFPEQTTCLRMVRDVKTKLMIEVSSKKDFDDQISKEKNVVALFYASWCPFCSRFLAVYDKVAPESKFAVFLHVRIDDYSNPLWEDYSVEAVPTAIFLVGGKVQRRLDGKLGEGLSLGEFNQWLKNIANDSCKPF